jgi:cell filamentation protein
LLFIYPSAAGHTEKELALIYSFREEKGRASRLLATLMALQAGLPLLDSSAMNELKEKYFAAVQSAKPGPIYYDRCNAKRAVG